VERLFGIFTEKRDDLRRNSTTTCHKRVLHASHPPHAAFAPLADWSGSPPPPAFSPEADIKLIGAR